MGQTFQVTGLTAAPQSPAQKHHTHPTPHAGTLRVTWLVT